MDRPQGYHQMSSFVSNGSDHFLLDLSFVCLSLAWPVQLKVTCICNCPVWMCVIFSKLLIVFYMEITFSSIEPRWWWSFQLALDSFLYNETSDLPPLVVSKKLGIYSTTLLPLVVSESEELRSSLANADLTLSSWDHLDVLVTVNLEILVFLNILLLPCRELCTGFQWFAILLWCEKVIINEEADWNEQQ